MCTILFAYKCHPQHSLIVASNRDEFMDRPTLQAKPWAENPNIVGGRDLLQGGSWMGLHANGRFAAVTNFRVPPTHTYPLSRGKLTADFLLSDDSPTEYLDKLVKDAQGYAPFNVLVGDKHSLYYYSNQSEDGVQKLEPGIYGLSNQFLDSNWPKVVDGKAKFERILKRHQDNLNLEELEVQESIFDMLCNEEKAPNSGLPDTGVGFEMEKALSSIFIRMPNYGTRSSTLITYNNSQWAYLEKNWDSKGQKSHLLTGNSKLN